MHKLYIFALLVVALASLCQCKATQKQEKHPNPKDDAEDSQNRVKRFYSWEGKR